MSIIRVIQVGRAASGIPERYLDPAPVCRLGLETKIKNITTGLFRFQDCGNRLTGARCDH